MKKIALLSVIGLLIGLLGFATNGFTKDESGNMTNTNQKLSGLIAGNHDNHSGDNDNDEGHDQHGHHHHHHHDHECSPI